MEEQSPISQSANTQSPKPVSPYFNFTDPNNPYRMENGDHTTLILVTELLTTENYVTWSRAMCRALRAKNKLGFISGIIARPASEEGVSCAIGLEDTWEFSSSKSLGVEAGLL
uniref:Retrotransposon Copia-like N-terminal domain-containing protein n=1 Tax=Populus alba TaxID=43335 RepID=A0A4U5QJD2_POPAL|nr:hypothetical protein D5086_0000078530 [Populus alba]